MISAAMSRAIPQNFKNFLRQRTLPWRLAKLLSPALPSTVCVDVGASHYPHVKWLMFLNSPENRWLAVEPNSENLGYLQSWPWASKVQACTTGLSQHGGKQTLFITNVDTGSSLLAPEIPESMKHRVTNLDYFFPVTEKEIDTLTLEQAMKDLPQEGPVFIKLDTQGTELSILQGAQNLFDQQRIVGIEMESTLLAQPVMKGSGKFWQACQYMESQGFELLHLKPIAAVGRNGKNKPNQNTYLNECDAVFALRRDVAKGLSTAHRAGLLAFYLTNQFFEEGLMLLSEDQALSNWLKERGCNIGQLTATLNQVI